MKDCSWRHNKIMFLENFYPRAHTGTVITKLHNKKVIIPFPVPSYKCFPTYQDKYHGKKRTFFCLESGKCCLQGCSGQRLPPTERQDCCSCIVRLRMPHGGTGLSMQSNKWSTESLFTTLGSKSGMQT